MKKFICALSTIALTFTLACGGDDGGDGDGDGDGDADAAASNEAPAASFTRDPACTTTADTEIAFTSSSTDADGDELTCSWRFNSSSNMPTATGCTVTGVKFPNASPYNVTLTVDDGNGGTDEATEQVPPCG